jgi:hypothetical protein
MAYYSQDHFNFSTYQPMQSRIGSLSQLPSTMGGPTGPLTPEVCSLVVRQQPVEALVANKEKARKPIDPPPFVQLKVAHAFDPQQQWQQNPYLFMRVSLIQEDRNHLVDGPGEQSLTGTYVSSLFRLKDGENHEGGFFIFGDLSVKVQGTFRLRFSLHEMLPEQAHISMLCTTTSDPFQVSLAKDFRGMKESTYLSTLFADQGVRLRLRKETRALAGGKRGRSEHPVADSGSPTAKRAQREDDDGGDYASSYPYTNDNNNNNMYRYPPPNPLPDSFVGNSTFPTDQFNTYPL